ncbi:NAD(P) transhydrogenase subunit alpha [Lichenicoccus sp.]|uniref:NAD(P) transhydrogenase subunit alpha n=1 Tax=Lichenicoccus sp. TaxID=2781899 RepID=UPI003D0B401E
MVFKVAVLKETRPHERRVAVVPSVVAKLRKLGAELCLQAGAGEAARFPDEAYDDVTFAESGAALLGDADIVLSVQPPTLEAVRAMRSGAALLCFVHAQKEPELVALLEERGITCFAMERVPRISRAQSMDALSSQAALAGYYAPLLGATQLPRILPMMTTAVGSLRPAKALVMGLGVAGLQALATARRLGAITEGYDVRPETREQALSLGAKFVDTGIDARGEGGYARELTDDEKRRVRVVVTAHIQAADLIVTTAAIPGRASPKLIDAGQIAGMKSGSVIVDLAAEGGGNCEGTVPGETIQVGPATIVAPFNVPSLLAQHASELYSKNLLNLIELLVHDGAVSLDFSDEVIDKTALTRTAARTPKLVTV